MLKIGVIGCGERIMGIVRKTLDVGGVELTCVCDLDIEKVKKIRLNEERFSGVRYYTDARQMLENEKLDGVLIGTRCSTHTKFASLVAEYDIPLFLEKPVCTNYQDLKTLKTLSTMEEKTVVSFPLRNSNIVAFVKDIIAPFEAL